MPHPSAWTFKPGLTRFNIHPCTCNTENPLKLFFDPSCMECQEENTHKIMNHGLWKWHEMIKWMVYLRLVMVSQESSRIFHSSISWQNHPQTPTSIMIRKCWKTFLLSGASAIHIQFIKLKIDKERTSGSLVWYSKPRANRNMFKWSTRILRNASYSSVGEIITRLFTRFWEALVDACLLWHDAGVLQSFLTSLCTGRVVSNQPQQPLEKQNKLYVTSSD